MSVANRRVLAAFLVILPTAAVWAIPVPTFNLDEITASADHIVVGTIISVTRSGPTIFKSSDGREEAGQSMHAVIQVDQTIKGQPVLSALGFEFFVPNVPNGYSFVSAHSYEMLFLKYTSGNRYVFSNPYYPGVAATPHIITTSGDPIGRVIEQLSGVLESKVASEQQHSEAIFAVSSSKTEKATGALERAFGQVDPISNLQVASALLERNDIIPLDLAVDTLLRDQGQTSYAIVHNLKHALAEGVRDERAIPSLTRLLTSHDAETRRAAASALWHTGSRSAVPALSSALWDEDQETRYYAVVGLAEISGQDAWRPLMDEFASNENRYLTHWREWARENR